MALQDQESDTYKFMIKRLFIVGFLIVLATNSLQAQEHKLIELSGIVTDQNQQPLSFVNIIIKNKERGTISDIRGMFSFPAQTGDTILFSSVGFKKVTLIIPDTLNRVHYPVEIMMPVDTIMIGEVKIFPWKTYAEFREAFKKLDLPHNDIERARHNIALIKTQIILSNTADPGVNFNYVMQQQYNKTSIQGQYPSIPILNPFNWARFIEALKNGDLKDENKKYRK
jgi:hypothetical protein